MKKFTFFGLFFCLLGFNSCLKDKCENTQTFTQWIPVYKTDTEFKATPQYEAARPLKNPGKIYFYGNYMFINEQKEGVHIIDNANVQSPKNIGFLKINGNVDIAIKGDILYADNYADLLAINISNVSQPVLTKRVESVFQGLFWRDTEKGWLVDYVPQKVTQVIDCQDPRLNGSGWFIDRDVVFTTADASFPSGTIKSAGARPSTGVGGSMARFTLYSDYLYTISGAQVNIFNLKKTDNPILNNSVTVAWNIETLFPHTDKLFIGSTTGMFIYDLSNPTNPTQLSNFTHGRACDPVVVEGDKAYVTLRSGTACNNGINQLLVVDVKDFKAPQLLKAYPMKNPRGLSVLDNILYLCDDGFKIFDASDSNAIDKNLKAHIPNFDTYDVISYYETTSQKVAMVIGADGFYQFDVTNPAQPKELSRIPVSQ